MKLALNSSLITFFLLASGGRAFTPTQPYIEGRATAFVRYNPTALNALATDDASMVRDLENELAYQPGKANSEFAKRFGNLSGQKVKTVAEAFTEFTETLGRPINPLYRSTITDIVGSTHLTVVDARFERDAVWSMGLLATMDMLLKNYPEEGAAEEITKALIDATGFDETTVRQEAAALRESLKGMSADEVTAALSGEGDSMMAQIASNIKSDEYWMYSKFFGVGLLKIMESVGVEMSTDTCYRKMEEWMSKSLEKPHFTACSDADQWFKVKSKLDMMETLMKEIEIREKKRMADRLEERAEAALRQAEREKEWAEEEAKDAVEREALQVV